MALITPSLLPLHDTLWFHADFPGAHALRKNVALVSVMG